MSTFTVASGPINFGASGADEDFFGGNSDQGFTAAAAYVQAEPSPEYPTTSYGNAPWDASGTYTAQEQATYPAAHDAAPGVHEIYKTQGQQQAPPGYSNPLYDAAATYQPPQAIGIEAWSAPAEAKTVPEYSYQQSPAAAPPPQQPTFEENSEAHWNSVPVAVASYEDSLAKRELDSNETIAPVAPPPPTNFTSSAPAAAPAAEMHQHQQPVAQASPWTMPTSNPSMSFTEDGAVEDEDAALFDQIDATFSENLDTDSLLSSSTGGNAASANAAGTDADAIAGAGAGAGAVTTSAPSTGTMAAASSTLPSMNAESYGQLYSPIHAHSQPTAAEPSPPPPPPMSKPPPPPMSPPRFQPAAYKPPSPPAAATTARPTYQYAPVSDHAQPYSTNDNTALPPPPAPAANASTSTGGSKPISRVSSLSSSPRPGNINLEAGRRKLEEYKRRKQAVLGARKAPGVSGTSSPRAGAQSGSTGGASDANVAAITERFQAELTAALSRATAAEASNSELSRDLNHVLRQLETVDQERNSLQREKAAMVGEMMTMQAALETAQAQAQAQAEKSVNVEEYENNMRNAELQIHELESARNDLIELLEKERNEHRQQLDILNAEKENAVVQGDESSHRASQHAQYNDELQQWIVATQADSQAVREDNDRLRQELDTALAAAGNTTAAGAPDSSSQTQQEQQQQQQQIAALRVELEGLHAQVEAERAQRNDLEMALSSSHLEQERERQSLMDQAAQLQTRLQELEQQMHQYPDYAHAGGRAGGGAPPSFIKQEDDQQQQQYYQHQQEQAYYGEDGAAEQQYSFINSEAAATHAVEAEHALTRALAAETAVEALKSELESARQEALSLREDVLRLKNEAATVDNLHSDSSLSSQKAVNGDPESLRYRLAKAEAAVEKERRVIQSLERQVRDSEAAAAEGRASTAAAFELRRRCDAAEREAAAAKTAVEQLQSAVSAGANSPNDAQIQQMLSRLRLAEEKSTSTDAIAADLRSQCDAAAKTIAKLVEENQNLVDRLNRQGNAMAELQESHHIQHHNHQKHPYSPGSPLAATHRPQVHELEQQQQQFNTPSPSHTTPPVWNIPGAVPIQQPPQHRGGEYYNGTPTEKVQESENGGRRDFSPRYSQESAGDSGGKKKGFWSWLAGEDLAG